VTAKKVDIFGQIRGPTKKTGSGLAEWFGKLAGRRENESTKAGESLEQSRGKTAKTLKKPATDGIQKKERND